MTTDASGNLSLIQFNIATPTTSFTNNYSAANLTTLSSLTLNQLATILNAVNTTAGANGFVTAPSTGLTSSTYGIWATNDTSSGRIGVFATGIPTPAASMPVTGTATYNGSTIGTASSASAGYALSGTVQLQANFATSTIGTTISNLQLQNISSNAVTNQSNLTGTGSIASNQYSGGLSGGTLTGTSTGTFYGTAASETAGAWKVAGGGVTAIGSYGAKR